MSPGEPNSSIRGPVSQIMSAPHLFWIVAGVIVCLYMALAIGQALTKQPMDDEAWLATSGYNLLTRGEMGKTLHESDGLLYHYTYDTMPLYYPVLVAWFKVWGFGLLSQRMMSIAWGILLMVSWYWIMKSLTNNRSIALLTFAFVGLDALIVRTAALGRFDIMCAAFGFGAYAVFLRLRERNLLAAIVISQSMIALSGLTHPNGFIEFLGLLYLTLSLDRKRIHWKEVCLAAFPYVVGAICWGLYISHNPPFWYSQIRGNYGHRGRGINVIHNLIVDFPHRFLVPFGFGPNDFGIKHLLILIIFVYFVGLLTSLFVKEIRQQPACRALHILLAIAWVLLSFQADYNPMEYTIHYLPVFAALLAITIHWLWLRELKWVPAIASAICFFILLQVGALAYRIKLDDYHRAYLPAVEFAKNHSDDNTPIMGSAILYFEYGFRQNLIDDVSLGYSTQNVADLIVVDPEWALEFQMQRDTNPGAYKHIQKILANDYVRIYDHANYQIYRRK